MSLDIQSLKRVEAVPYAAGESKSLHFYATGDALATVSASAYFNNATKQLRKGDVIFCSLVNGGTPACAMLIVSSASGATPVTTVLSTATAAT